MQRLLKPLVLAACLLGPGCSFVHQIKRNLINEPLLACDERAIRRQSTKLAKQAWNEMVRQYGDCFSCDYRAGFVDGFTDYLVYGGCVGAGGCGAGQGGTCANGTCAANPPATATAGSAPAGASDPGHAAGGESSGIQEYPVCPPVPPERYRRKRFMTPEGYQAIEEWFTGFRHGASTAMASGLRNLVVLPVQCPPQFGIDDGGQPPTSTRPTARTLPQETSPMPPPDEITQPGAGALPPPRPAGDTSPMPPTLPPTPPGA